MQKMLLLKFDCFGFFLLHNTNFIVLPYSYIALCAWTYNVTFNYAAKISSEWFQNYVKDDVHPGWLLTKAFNSLLGNY